MVRVYADYITKEFHAPRFSWAWVVRMLAWVVVIVLPFFLAFWSHSFWLKESTFREVPIAKFKYKLVALLEGYNGYTGAHNQLVWSTIPEVNEAVGWDRVKPPDIKVSERDVDLDGRNDFFDMSLKMPLMADEVVNRVSLLLFFDVSLSRRFSLQMESAVYVSETSSLPGTALFVNGDFKIKQVEPLNVARQRTVYSASVLDPSTVVSVADVRFPVLLAKLFERNETTVLESPHSFWQAGTGQDFSINMTMRIPEQPISYIPSPAETLKFAWVQYVSVAALVYFFVNYAQWFCFTQQVLTTRVRSSTTPVTKLHEF